jgi:hypothetical protein
MRRTPASVGCSLRRTPPPPFTWTSIKPGRQDHIGGKLDSRARRRLAEGDALDPPLRNPDRAGAAHVVAIKDALRGNRQGGTVTHQRSSGSAVTNG